MHHLSFISDTSGAELGSYLSQNLLGMTDLQLIDQFIAQPTVEIDIIIDVICGKPYGIVYYKQMIKCGKHISNWYP